jgi:hypothetical protein
VGFSFRPRVALAFRKDTGRRTVSFENREGWYPIEIIKLKFLGVPSCSTLAFSSLWANDIQKAKEFYGKTLGLELSSGPEGTLVVPLSGGTKALMYPKPNHQPATFTV